MEKNSIQLLMRFIVPNTTGKLLLPILLFANFWAGAQSGLGEPKTNSTPEKTETKDVFTPDYRIYEELLTRYVSEDGTANIKGLKGDKDFQTVLQSIKLFQPDGNWTREQTMCFWINVYNIHVLKMLCDNYGKKSINEIERPWETPVFKLGLKHNYSLNQIREIIRKKYNDPRIHFALYMGNVSSPPLYNKPYRPESVNKILSERTRSFIADPLFNVITENSMKLNRLFELYKSDFTANVSLYEWVNRFSDVKVNERAAVEYMDFDWTIRTK